MLVLPDTKRVIDVETTKRVGVVCYWLWHFPGDLYRLMRVATSTDPEIQSFGHRMKDSRERLGYTKEQMARAYRVCFETLEEMESGALDATLGDA